MGHAYTSITNTGYGWASLNGAHALTWDTFQKYSWNRLKKKTLLGTNSKYFLNIFGRRRRAGSTRNHSNNQDRYAEIVFFSKFHRVAYRPWSRKRRRRTGDLAKIVQKIKKRRDVWNESLPPSAASMAGSRC